MCSADFVVVRVTTVFARLAVCVAQAMWQAFCTAMYECGRLYRYCTGLVWHLWVGLERVVCAVVCERQAPFFINMCTRVGASDVDIATMCSCL